MTPTAGSPRDAGFTLIEVMISLFFLSFIVGGMATISVYATRSSTYAQRLTRANMIAEAVIEASRNTAFDKQKTKWYIDNNGNNSGDAGEPMETACSDTNGNGHCDAGVEPDLADPASVITPVTFTWTYDIQNGVVIPTYFTRSRTVQYQSSGDADGSFTADVNVTVSWTDTRSQVQQVRLASVISKF